MNTTNNNNSNNNRDNNLTAAAAVAATARAARKLCAAAFYRFMRALFMPVRLALRVRRFARKRPAEFRKRMQRGTACAVTFGFCVLLAWLFGTGYTALGCALIPLWLCHIYYLANWAEWLEEDKTEEELEDIYGPRG